MTATTQRFDLPSHVDLDHIERQAAFTADQLATSPTVIVSLTPGDATVYHVLIVRQATVIPAGDEYPFAQAGEWIVSLLNLDGNSYPWAPQVGPPHWTYVLGKWTEHEHTAKVLAAFLRLLWDELRVQAVLDV